MTTIPTIEKTEETKCIKCERSSQKLCTVCGKNFCKKHLVIHFDRCSGYRSVIRAVLHDDITEMLRQIMEALVRTV